MRRGFILVLLVMTLVSQLLAISGRADSLGHGEEDTHAMLHWKGEAHHHLDDGSLQHDDSDASTQHLLVDQVLTAPGLVSSGVASLPLPVAQRPLSLDRSPIPDPHLPGIKRPPRRMA